MDLKNDGNGKATGRLDTLATTTKAEYSLQDAARRDQPTVGRHLLECVRSMTMLDDEGWTASHRAREATYCELADEPEDCEVENLSASSKRSEMERLSIKELIGLIEGEPHAVTELIAAGRIRAVDSKGDTALHICAAKGRLHSCDQLIKAGADPTVMNFERKQPHERAAENGHVVVASLLQSLLSFVSPETSMPNAQNRKAAEELSVVPQPASDTFGDCFDLEEFELEFDGQEEAEDFHRKIERQEYVTSFNAVEGRVTRLADEDGDEFHLDDLAGGGFWIDADDIVGRMPRTAEHADAATFRSFLDVRMGRKSAFHGSAPTTRYYAISEIVLRQWVEKLIPEGTCTSADVDSLIGEIRGSFDPEIVRGNLFRELINIGLLKPDDENHDDACISGEIPDQDDIVDLLSCICNGNNMRPGMEFTPLTRRAEASLFRDLAAARQNINRIIVSNATLVSIVIMLGQRVEDGTYNPSLLTDLDIQPGRQSPDVEALSSALSCLSGYQTLLEGGDVTSEDREKAINSLSALKLTRMAIELIAAGIQENTALSEPRQAIEKSIKVQDRHRRDILLAHLPLVRRQASRREAYVQDVEDLVHDGVFGLIWSIDRFEPDRGFRFMNYCQFGVRQSISRGHDDTGSLIRVPSHRAVVLRKVDRLEERISEELPEEAIIALISEHLEIPAETIREVRAIPRRPVSFEEISAEHLDMDSPQFSDYLAHQRSKVIEDMLADMPERKADILVHRFGLRGEDEKTLEELGIIYGVTRERIRQIEAKCLADMGRPSNQRLLRSLL